MTAYFRLYVYKYNTDGRVTIVPGQIFFNRHIAIGIAENYCNMYRYHAKVTTGNKVIFNR